ncbi:hypothetical protein Sjap_009394 [Stephania japonica]|uniref:SAP domain-containing protein n=1 Tax=Stephania japonica TaxID=461633 RepID=A0AAP0JS93_9MAGN
MGSLEGEEFYYKLSRKELQELCKKHGLPANKTKSQLANLLASFFQKKNVSLVPLTERADGPVAILPHKSVESDSKVAGGKEEAIRILDIKGLHKRGVETAFVNTFGHPCAKDVDKEQPPYNDDEERVSGGTTNRVPATFPINDVENSLGFKIHENKGCVLSSSQCGSNLLKFSHKDPLNFYQAVDTVQKLPSPSRDVGHEFSPQSQCGGKYTSKSLVEKGLETSTDVPSFQFYVRSEEGISLYVDLNSNPFDWITKMKNEVCIYPEVQNKKSWNLQCELKILGDGDARIKASLLGNAVEDPQIRSDSVFGNAVENSIMEESDHVEVDQSDINGSLVSQLCKTESHMWKPKDASTEQSPNRSDRVDSSHEFHDISLKKTVCSVVNSKPDGPEDQNLSEPHSKSESIHVENTETGSIGTSGISQQTMIPPSHKIGAALLPRTRSAENSSVIGLGCSTSSSMDMQLSEVASHCDDTTNSAGLNGNRPHSDEAIQKLQTGYVGSSNCGFDLSTSAGPTLANPDEQGGNDAINGTGSSECSQNNEFSMRTSERLHSPEDDGRQSKRQRRNPNDRIGQPVSTTSNIVSGKDMARQGLPRRSMRLVSK